MIFTVFERFAAHPKVSKYFATDIENYYGVEPTRGPTTTPHIEWVPGEEEIGPTSWKLVPQIVDGKTVMMEGTNSRQCSVEIRIYEKTHKALEMMVLDVYNAIYDVMESQVNIKFESGQTYSRGQLSEKSHVYVLRVRIGIPLYRLLPTVNIENYDINETLQQEGA